MNRDDPRARRSLAKLHTAVLDLAADDGSIPLTMAQVARRAGVNRATVYQHFPDVDALLLDALDEALTHLARAAALCPLDAPTDRAPEPLTDLFRHVGDRAALYRRLLGPQGSAPFAARLRERLTDALAASFTEGRRPSVPGAVPARTHAAYLAGALLGVLADWVTADRPATARQAADAFWCLLRG